MPISGVGVGLFLAGGIVAWSGIHGKGIGVTTRDLLTGKQPAPLTATAVAPQAGTSSAGGSVGANQAIGRVLAAPYGWAAGTQWNALQALWDRESGWNNRADTRVTGAGGDHAGSMVFAYGIAQARPATKYPKPGQPSDLGGISSASVQIAWGLNYIRSVYGNPVNAWTHEQSAGWY